MANKEPVLHKGEKIDRLGYQGLRIIQNPTKFKFTIDAFLLAEFIDPKPRQEVCDLGTGGGVIPLLVAGQNEVRRVYGIEIQSELVDMAVRSVSLNNLDEKVVIIEGDLRVLPPSLDPNSFDFVTANPPFYPPEKGVLSGNNALALAKFEISCTLEDVVRAASRLVKGNGKVALIYPSERMPELLANLSRFHLTPKKIRFIHPQSSVKSNLLLVEARPSAKSGIEVLPPLFVYNDNGEYTKEMNQIFQGKEH